MKKVTRIILILSILALSGCDFFRNVAGRPDSAAIEQKARKIEQRRLELSDSLSREQERIRVQQQLISDSLSTLERIRQDGWPRISSVSRFGTPAGDLQHRYYLVVGVYRSAQTSSRVLTSLRGIGYQAGFLSFPEGVKSVYMAASDCLCDIKTTADEAKRAGDCPPDAWIYLNEKN